MNLKPCLFSFYFLFQFYLNEGSELKQMINTIGDAGVKKYLEDNFAKLEKKFNILEEKIVKKFCFIFENSFNFRKIINLWVKV